MILEAILLGIIIGYIRKGKISRLKYINFSAYFLIIIPIIIRIVLVIINLGLVEYSTDTDFFTILLTTSYILLVIGLIFNINLKYFFLILIGLILNTVCFLINNFRFPIKGSIVKVAYGNEIYDLLISNNIKYFVPFENAKLDYLGNFIFIHRPYFKPLILSIGDIIVAVGIVLFIQSVMSDRFIKSKGKLRFSKDIFKK